MRIIREDGVEYKGNLYPKSDFKYKCTDGKPDYGARRIFVAEIKGVTVTEGKLQGVATGEVEHYLCNYGDEFYRYECNCGGKLLWLTQNQPVTT